MNSKTFVATLVLVLATAALLVTSQAQQLHRGVSVQMVTTHNASPMPEADNEDAWVVAVTADGSFYLGGDLLTADELADWMKSHPRNREAKLYVKADARTPFASVERVLEIGRTMYFETPELLTSQAEQAQPGVMMPPKGLEVMVATPAKDGVVVQIGAGQPPTLEVNDAQISPSALQGALQALLQNRTEKVVVVKAAGTTPFVQVVNVVDICRSIGAKAALATSEL